MMRKVYCPEVTVSGPRGLSRRVGHGPTMSSKKYVGSILREVRCPEDTVSGPRGLSRGVGHGQPCLVKSIWVQYCAKSAALRLPSRDQEGSLGELGTDNPIS